MKVLLFGKDGQVGRALAATLAGRSDLVALGRAEADFEQPEGLAGIVAAHRPDVVINAAAYTAVDKAESEPDRAHRINAEAVGRIAAATRAIGAWLIHYSTDYVYDGTKIGAYVETDPPAPLSTYGRTKHLGDVAVARAGGRHLILRVSWVYANGRANFPRTMLRLARDRETLRVVADQIGAPTSADFIARLTAAALYRPGGLDAMEGGVYHLAPDGAVDRAAYVRFLLDCALEQGASLTLRPDRVESIATAEYPLPATRPLNSRLATTKLRTALGLEELPDWRDDARRWVVAELEGEGI
jgi:dTDP-4-dehydrorhamnose reductase